MKQQWLAVIVTAGAVLSGCASSSGGCRVPAYVVPPPLPPLQIPQGLSAPRNESRYATGTVALPATPTRRPPGAGRSAEPPDGKIAPAPARLPLASSSTSAPATSGSADSSSSP